MADPMASVLHWDLPRARWLEPQVSSGLIEVWRFAGRSWFGSFRGRLAKPDGDPALAPIVAMAF
jgi:hypothetical protein